MWHLRVLCNELDEINVLEFFLEMYVLNKNTKYFQKIEFIYLYIFIILVPKSKNIRMKIVLWENSR